MILHIPHSSTYIPEDIKFLKQDINADLFRMTDHFTDELFDVSATDVVKFGVSRLVCDVERLLHDEPMEEYGMGVCYTNDSFGKKLRNVSIDERQRIIDEYYVPHHDLLQQKVNFALCYFENVAIVDCHSFSNEQLPHEEEGPRPDFCIGTDYFHTPDDMLEDMYTYLIDNGYTCEINHPFAGTIVPLEHYQKNKNVLSVMIEVNRSLYMDGPSKSDDFDKTKGVIKDLLNIVEQYEI